MLSQSTFVAWCRRLGLGAAAEALIAAIRLRADHLPVAPAAAAEVVRLVAGTPGLPLTTLLQRLSWASADDVYALIATGHVYVDLRAAPLAEPDQVVVWRDAQVARVAGLLASLPPAGTPPPAAPARILRASPGALAQAVERYARLAPYLTGQPPTLPLAGALSPRGAGRRLRLHRPPLRRRPARQPHAAPQPRTPRAHRRMHRPRVRDAAPQAAAWHLRPLRPGVRGARLGRPQRPHLLRGHQAATWL